MTKVRRIVHEVYDLTEAEMAELTALVAKLPSTTSAMQAAE